MGRRGPAPQPTALKIARGNPGKRPINEREPVPVPGEITSPPSHLAGRSLEKWNELFPILQGMRIFTPADAETLARYCILWEQWLVFVGYVRDGTVSSPPAATMCLKLSPLLLRIEQEFGLTPSARSNLIALDKTPEDDEILLSKYA